MTPDNPQERLRALDLALVRDALDFFVWAAGEGLCPATGEPAGEPEEILFKYATETGDENYDGYGNAIIARLDAASRSIPAGEDAERPGEVTITEERYREYQRAEALARQQAEEIGKLRKAIQDYLSGDYPHPRQYRPNNCPHGTLYWQECEQCNTAHFEAALSKEEQPAALRSLSEDKT